jgi:hypothetical protein
MKSILSISIITVLQMTCANVYGSGKITEEDPMVAIERHRWEIQTEEKMERYQQKLSKKMKTSSEKGLTDFVPFKDYHKKKRRSKDDQETLVAPSRETLQSLWKKASI